MKVKDKLKSLTENDIWIFTKQSTSFDTAFKSVCLFEEALTKDNVNLEEYFAENHSRFEIDTDRHRVLVMAQFFGLLTKTPYYKKGGQYLGEKPTEIFEKLKKSKSGDLEYNTLKTEQILKVKIRAIIDTVNSNMGWHILPVIFSFKVLKTLKDEHKIDKVDLGRFYTYVMTCSNYGDVSNAVEFIKNNEAVSDHFTKFKDRSRFQALLDGNIELFLLDEKAISLNPLFENYFNEKFMNCFDIDELNLQLLGSADYTYFLNTFQNCNINLINLPTTIYAEDEEPHKQKRKKKVYRNEKGILEDDDTDYVEKVNEVKEYNLNENIAIDAYKIIPASTLATVSKRYSKNPLLGKIAVQRAMYLCENDKEHPTFTSAVTKKPFMEAHHLIPIYLVDDMWEKFMVNIDCRENIVSLCPNCHRQIHYATTGEKTALIEKIYQQKEQELETIGICITLDELKIFY